MKISSSITFPINSTPKLHEYNKVLYWSAVSNGSYSISKISGIFSNGSASHGAESRAVGDAYGRRSRLESLFCYDKPIPEERIEEPVGVSLAEKIVGDNPRCSACQAKGVILCTTCAGSGLYVDSILESQGIIVKVRCLSVVEEPAMSCAQNAVAVVIEGPSNLWLAAFYM
ncbi:hypothetical protein ES319_D08G260500v1 [Gossypium barbadense]|uniref:DnaJ/Hsp40 cysteine-rich domain superfamily protein n=1 Tax=Gossypium barbadense TaxID=3634 RepID=A0A5J5QKT8_GOSBA|nr:hypothetical protein ES319_D08G260500v1 [Gossypium barbadense]